MSGQTQHGTDEHGWLDIRDLEGVKIVSISPENQIVEVYGTDGSVLATWDRRVSPTAAPSDTAPVSSPAKDWRVSHPDWTDEQAPLEVSTLPLQDVLEAAADGGSITDAWHKVAAKVGSIHSVMYRDGRHGTLCGIAWPAGGQMLRATSVADDVTCKECRAKLDPGQVKADLTFGQPAHYAGTSISRAKTAAGRARDNSQRIRELYEAGIVHVPAGAPLEDVARALWGTDEEAKSTREAFRTALSVPVQLAMGLTDAEKDAIALSTRLWDALVDITGYGHDRSGDLAELARSIHDIQARIMGQAAARAHPDLLRPLGGNPVAPK